MIQKKKKTKKCGSEAAAQMFKALNGFNSNQFNLIRFLSVYKKICEAGPIYNVFAYTDFVNEI